MKEHFPQSNDARTSGLTLLGNTYGSVGNVNKVKENRDELIKSGLKKPPGLSTTSVNGELYVNINHRIFSLSDMFSFFFRNL